MSKKFSVLDMAEEYAANNDIDTEDLFKKPEIITPPKTEDKKEEFSMKPIMKDSENIVKKETEDIPEDDGWRPDESLLKGMDEMKPVVFDKKDLKQVDDGPLRNIADDNAIQEARESMDDLQRKSANIEDAKARFGISKLQIPPGEWQVRILAAAGDTNYQRSKEALDAIFKEVIEKFPEFVLEWSDESKRPHKPSEETKIVDIPKEEDKIIDDAAQNTVSVEEDSDAKVVIDKSRVSDLTWSKEEVDKIRKSRSIELNIVEDKALKYSEIEDVDDNAVDMVLSQYQRKANDVVASLPASRYRATLTGLSYPEILDLTHAQDVNTLDMQRKKWSIVFQHLKNPSIGDWKEYKWYIDPKTKKKVIIDFKAIEPDDENIVVHEVTKFDDFLMKTSFMDLEFLLWKILCATAMDKEIISIDCHAKLSEDSDKVCGNSYDWIYSPSDLLDTSSISEEILKEMKEVGEANSVEEIEKYYNSSMLNIQNTVELPHSKFRIVFGHISAFDHLNSVYGAIHDIEEKKDVDVSEAISTGALMITKAFLLPKDNHYVRIKGPENILKIMMNLDEVDYQTVNELLRIMMEPYQFRFSLRNICCPKCKNKSNIVIDSMTRLLFIVARSLSSVQVVLKRT